MFEKINFNKKKTNKGILFAAGALIGGLVGSITAIFLTPFSGKKARNLVAEKTKKGADWVVDEAESKKEAVSKKASDVISAIKKDDSK